MERNEIFQNGSSDRSLHALEEGALLRDQFRVGRVLGIGGFGITYLAFDEVLELAVAVKEYLPNHIAVRQSGSHQVHPLSTASNRDFEFGLERFLQEARMLAKFEDHPNIVRVRSFFEENGTGYLVMNYYEGQTMAEYLDQRNGLIPEGEALLIMEQVLNGLRAVHEKGILHRDIDPKNIYLADNGRVVLLDFGAARMAVSERTQSLSVVLKRGYAPHEQYHSQGEQGPWTDIYTCAATLYRAVTGYKPPEAAARIIDDELVAPKELVPSLSDATNEAILQGLSVQPEERPASVEAFAALLPDVPSGTTPGWCEDEEEVSSPAPSSGDATLQVTASHACRLYVDGQRTAELSAEETRTVEVASGTHRLRAVRLDQAGTDTATVTATGERPVETPEEGAATTLDALVWKDVVSISSRQDVPLAIQFQTKDEETGQDAVSDGAATSEETEESPGAFESLRSATSSSFGSAFDAEPQEEVDEEASRLLSFLLVRADRACQLFVDGERHDHIEAETLQWIPILPGRHQIRAEAAEDSFVWEQDVDTEAGESTSVTITLDHSKPESVHSKRFPYEVLPDLSTRQVSARQVLIGLAILLVGMVGAGVWGSGSDPVSVSEQGGTPLVAQPDRVVTMTETVVDVLANDQGVSRAGMGLQSVEVVGSSGAEAEIVDAARVRIRPASGAVGTTRVRYTVATVGGTTAQSYVSVEIPFSGNGQLVTGDAEGPQVVHAADLSGLTRPDLVVASYDDNMVGWLENRRSGNSPYGALQPLTQYAEGALDVHTADLTGDGRLDVLAAAEMDGAVTWYENEGNGTFSDPRLVTAEAAGAVSVQAADINGDDRPDVIVGARQAGHVLWYENRGDGEFASPRPIVQDVDRLGAVHVADLTDDDRPDVLVTSLADGTVTWYENWSEREGPLYFGERRVLDASLDEPIDVYAADLTGNGRRDVLASGAGEDVVVWYKNENGRAGEKAFGGPRRLASGIGIAEDFVTADLEGNGTEDVFVASFQENAVLWFNNRGRGHFDAAQPIATQIQEALSVETADVDGDGDPDLLSASQADDRVVWYENHLQP